MHRHDKTYLILTTTTKKRIFSINKHHSMNHTYTVYSFDEKKKKKTRLERAPPDTQSTIEEECFMSHRDLCFFHFLASYWRE